MKRALQPESVPPWTTRTGTPPSSIEPSSAYTSGEGAALAKVPLSVSCSTYLSYWRREKSTLSADFNGAAS